MVLKEVVKPPTPDLRQQLEAGEQQYIHIRENALALLPHTGERNLWSNENVLRALTACIQFGENENPVSHMDTTAFFSGKQLEINGKQTRVSINTLADVQAILLGMANPDVAVKEPFHCNTTEYSTGNGYSTGDPDFTPPLAIHIHGDENSRAATMAVIAIAALEEHAKRPFLSQEVFLQCLRDALPAAKLAPYIIAAQTIDKLNPLNTDESLVIQVLNELNEIYINAIGQDEFDNSVRESPAIVRNGELNGKENRLVAEALHALRVQYSSEEYPEILQLTREEFGLTSPESFTPQAIREFLITLHHEDPLDCIDDAQTPGGVISIHGSDKQQFIQHAVLMSILALEEGKVTFDQVKDIFTLAAAHMMLQPRSAYNAALITTGNLSDEALLIVVKQMGLQYASLVIEAKGLLEVTNEQMAVIYGDVMEIALEEVIRSNGFLEVSPKLRDRFPEFQVNFNKKLSESEISANKQQTEAFAKSFKTVRQRLREKLQNEDKTLISAQDEQLLTRLALVQMIYRGKVSVEDIQNFDRKLNTPFTIDDIRSFTQIEHAIASASAMEYRTQELNQPNRVNALLKIENIQREYGYYYLTFLSSAAHTASGLHGKIGPDGRMQFCGAHVHTTENNIKDARQQIEARLQSISANRSATREQSRLANTEVRTAARFIGGGLNLNIRNRVGNNKSESSDRAEIPSSGSLERSAGRRPRPVRRTVRSERSTPNRKPKRFTGELPRRKKPPIVNRELQPPQLYSKTLEAVRKKNTEKKKIIRAYMRTKVGGTTLDKTAGYVNVSNKVDADVYVDIAAKSTDAGFVARDSGEYTPVRPETRSSQGRMRVKLQEHHRVLHSPGSGNIGKLSSSGRLISFEGLRAVGGSSSRGTNRLRLSSSAREAAKGILRELRIARLRPEVRTEKIFKLDRNAPRIISQEQIKEAGGISSRGTNRVRVSSSPSTAERQVLRELRNRKIMAGRAKKIEDNSIRNATTIFKMVNDRSGVISEVPTASQKFSSGAERSKGPKSGGPSRPSPDLLNSSKKVVKKISNQVKQQSKQRETGALIKAIFKHKEEVGEQAKTREEAMRAIGEIANTAATVQTKEKKAGNSSKMYQPNQKEGREKTTIVKTANGVRYVRHTTSAAGVSNKLDITSSKMEEEELRDQVKDDVATTVGNKVTDIKQKLAEAGATGNMKQPAVSIPIDDQTIEEESAVRAQELPLRADGLTLAAVIPTPGVVPTNNPFEMRHFMGERLYLQQQEYEVKKEEDVAA